MGEDLKHLSFLSKKELHEDKDCHYYFINFQATALIIQCSISSIIKNITALK